MLTDGIDVEFKKDGRNVHDKVWLIDTSNIANNNWLVVNQFTVKERETGRPDVLVFVNGLPLAILELKNPVDDKATTDLAYNQLQTYKQDSPSLFTYNELMVISDGFNAMAGTVTSNKERFMTWRTIDGVDLAPAGKVKLEVLIKGIFEKKRFLDLILNFTAFEVNRASIIKKTAAYHQYHAVNKAVECTVQATSESGDKRIGVVWHTQGSGKSLSMLFYAGKIIQEPAMKNPTIVVLTDRNDLDEQLFNTFSASQALLRQPPKQADDRNNLKDLLKITYGGVIFTTIQKFLPENKGDKYPLLSDRRNIIVIADEAHRSQYDFIDGFARHMRDALPNASFIGFTGTPIEFSDKNTRSVFGEYIDTYDILQAVEDKATVPIYYEGRLARIELVEDEKPKIDYEFEEVTEDEEESGKQKLKQKWARLEAMVGTEKRIDIVAKDIIKHFEDRLDAMDGKGLIVCMSRRICVDLYSAIIDLKPEWHHEDDDRGFIKVVMSGSASDKLEFKPHIRSKVRREELAKNFKTFDNPLKLVIVRDMWLTGFDCPSMHTMYIDKPMRGHGLMQAIARVNRVFRDKPGGLVVDYLGLADQLKKALKNYSDSGGKGKVKLDQEEAVAIMLELYEVVCGLLHGFDYKSVMSSGNRLSGIALTMEHICAQQDGKKRYIEGSSGKSVLSIVNKHHLKLPIDKKCGNRDLI